MVLRTAGNALFIMLYGDEDDVTPYPIPPILTFESTK